MTLVDNVLLDLVTGDPRSETSTRHDRILNLDTMLGDAMIEIAPMPCSAPLRCSREMRAATVAIFQS